MLAISMKTQLQELLRRVPFADGGSAALYIFKPACADGIALATLLFILALIPLNPLPYTLLLALTAHVSACYFLHSVNLAKLTAKEEIVSPLQAQVELLKVRLIQKGPESRAWSHKHRLSTPPLRLIHKTHAHIGAQGKHAKLMAFVDEVASYKAALAGEEALQAEHLQIQQVRSSFLCVCTFKNIGCYLLTGNSLLIGPLQPQDCSAECRMHTC